MTANTTEIATAAIAWTEIARELGTSPTVAACFAAAYELRTDRAAAEQHAPRSSDH